MACSERVRQLAGSSVSVGVSRGVFLGAIQEIR
jgi:hypothetical protein